MNTGPSIVALVEIDAANSLSSLLFKEGIYLLSLFCTTSLENRHYRLYFRTTIDPDATKQLLWQFISGTYRSASAPKFWKAQDVALGDGYAEFTVRIL